MRSWTQLDLAGELDRAGVKVPLIAQRVGGHWKTARLCITPSLTAILRR